MNSPRAILGDAFDTYVQAYNRPGAVRGMIADYHVNAEDIAQDEIDATIKISYPVLAILSASFDTVGK